uniref:Uncharacterized protein n=1 Tax=Arundo donax TaxID=35708 RepID=A0A0A9HM34_ARUDO
MSELIAVLSIHLLKFFCAEVVLVYYSLFASEEVQSSTLCISCGQ